MSQMMHFDDAEAGWLVPLIGLVALSGVQVPDQARKVTEEYAAMVHGHLWEGFPALSPCQSADDGIVGSDLEICFDENSWFQQCSTYGDHAVQETVALGTRSYYRFPVQIPEQEGERRNTVMICFPARD